MCIVLIRKILDKIMSTGHFTGLYAILLRSIRVSPAKVIKDCPGKENIFLQNHGNVFI